MRFADVPGLYEIKNVLANAINEQQVAHAQLFLSAKGALNLPLAIAYASYLHCTNKTGTDSCGTCAACSKSLKFIHPDTHFIFPLSNVLKESDEDKQKANILKLWRNFLLEKPYGDEDDWLSFYGGEDKQANISKETARDIIKSLSLKPFESNYKVMIIWMPEYMHPSAANAILKILEEPAAQTVFLLVTNQAEKLLPTILSRTQIHSVPLLDDIELQSYLTDKLGFEKSKVESIITLAEGSINRAVKIMDNAEEDNRQTFTEWMRSCFKREYDQLIKFSEQFHESDKLSQRNFFDYSLHILRESLVHISGAGTNRMRGEDLDFVGKFSSIMNLQRVDHLYNLINEASYHLERNGSAKMIFFDLSIQISQKLNS